MTIDRRTFLGTAAAAGALLAAPRIGRAAETVKLGSILDTSGNFDAYGKPMKKGLDLAVAEINESGGLNGREVEVIHYDTQSDMALYTQYAQQLTRRDKVDVVQGGILSASREAIRPTMRKYKVPYFYNPLYEGGVCDRNTFCTGITPAQQVEVLVPYAMEQWGKRVYVLAADYNYGQIMAKWFQKYIADNGGETVAVEFFPLDVSDFNATIAKIQEAAPDMVISALVGAAHLSFYRQWAAAGMNARIPMASTTLGVGNEHVVLTPEEGDGILCAYSYSKQLDTPQNAAFLDSWAGLHGDTDDIHEIAVSHYQGVKLWAEGVRKAGTHERMPMIEAMESGVGIEAPTGTVTIDPQTHHAVLPIHIMEIRDQQLQVLKSFGPREPIDTQRVCDLQANPDTNQQFEIEI